LLFEELINTLYEQFVFFHKCEVAGFFKHIKFRIGKTACYFGVGNFRADVASTTNNERRCFDYPLFEHKNRSRAFHVQTHTAKGLPPCNCRAIWGRFWLD
jgi:hypothetical protein